MALSEHTEYKIDNINTENKTISIAKYDIIKKDGIEISRSKPHRCAFVPGQIENIKEYIGQNDGPVINMLNALWTQEIIKEYNDKISNQE